MASATEKIGIALEILDKDGTLAFFRQIDSYRKSWNNTKVKLGLKEELRATKEEIVSLNRQKILSKSPKEIQAINDQLKSSAQRVRELQQAIRNLNSMSFGQVYRKVSSFTKQIGSAILTFGDAMQNLTSIGNRIMTGVFAGFGYRALGVMQQGLSKAIERSDIKKTYEPLVRAMGFDPTQEFGRFMDTASANSAKKTATAYEQLYDSVLGLPTGIDEIIDAQKNYAIAMNDFEKATGTAIAANNAFLANATSEADKQIGDRMLRTFASTGKLNARQFMALQRTMPMTFKNIGKELGFETSGAFYEALKSGAVNASQFFDGLIKEGTRGATATAVNEMKETLNSVISNYQNAFARLGEGVLNALSDVLEQTRGQNIYQFLNSIKDGIDRISEGIQNWIRSNPQKINEWIERLKSVDWLGLLKGIAQGFEHVLNVLTTFLKGFGKFNTQFVGKLLIGGALWGKIITTIGGLVKGASPLFGLGGATLYKGTGILQTIFNGVLGKNPAKVAEDAKKASETAGDAIQTIKGYTEETAQASSSIASSATKSGSAMATAKAGMKNFAINIGKFALSLGAIVATAGAIMLVVKAVKQVVKDAKEISDLVGQVDWHAFANVMLTFASAMVVLGGIGAKLAPVAPQILIGVGAISAIGIAIGAMMTALTWFGKKSTENIKKIVDNITETIKGFKNLKTEMGGISASDFEGLSEIAKIFEKLDSFIKASKRYFSTGLFLSPKKSSLGDVNKLANIMKDLKKVFKSLSNISKILDEIKVPTTGQINKVRELGKAVGEIVNALESDFAVDIIFPKGTENLSKVMTNVSTVFTTLKNIVSTIDGFYAQLEKLFHHDEAYKLRTDANGYGSKKWKGEMYDEWQYTAIIDYFKQGIANLANAVKEIYVSLEEAFTGENAKEIIEFADGIHAFIGTGTLEGTNEKYGIVGEVLTSVNNTFTTLSTIVGTINGFYESLESLFHAPQLEKGQKTQVTGTIIDSVKNNIIQLGNDLAEIFEALKEAFSGERLVSSLNALGVSDVNAVSTMNTMKSNATGTAGILEQMNNAFTYVKTIVETIKGFHKNLETVMGGASTEDTIIAKVVAYMESLAQSLSTLFDNLAETIGADFDATATTTNLETLKGAFESINGILAQIQTINTTYADLDTNVPSIDAITNAINKLNKMSTDVDVNALLAKVNGISVAISGFNTALAEFVSTEIHAEMFSTLNTALMNILTTAQQLTTHLATEGANWGKSIVEGFTNASIETKILEIVSKIPSKLASLATRFFDFGMSLGEKLKLGIQSALSSIEVQTTINIRALQGAITGLESIRDNVRRAVSNMSGVSTVYPSKGGRIGRNGVLYRARGGSIFKRKGTDIVPAMLTPGEYVMRRKAVNKFGQDFMRRVNALDVKGALRSLMTRSGMSVIPRQTSTVNNVKNNNAKVTQNIYSNNPNFAYRRANKWVGQL